jgi:hypothetical protein
MVEALSSQRWAKRLDQMIILTVIILIECSKGTIGQSARIRLRRLRERAEILTRVAKDVADYPIAVVASHVHGFGQIHEPPHELQRLHGIALSDVINNCTALRLEIGGEIAHLAPEITASGPRWMIQDMPRYRLARLTATGAFQ